MRRTSRRRSRPARHRPNAIRRVTPRQEDGEELDFDLIGGPGGKAGGNHAGD